MIQKTALFGGTFDPVHNGHLELACAAGSLYQLSEVVLLPAAVPPHKQHQEISAFRHRVAMLEIAVHSNPLLHISPLEQLLPSPSYTIDTLNYMQLHSAAELELYFIIGVDAFLDILSWRSYNKILEICDFIVFLRNGYQEQRLYTLLCSMGYQKDGRRWCRTSFAKYIYTPNVSLPAVSSSQVRDKVRQGTSLKGIVPDDVANYIYDNSLYID